MWIKWCSTWKTGYEICLSSDVEEVPFMPVTTEIRVCYTETDRMAAVYSANYFVWFEAGGPRSRF